MWSSQKSIGCSETWAVGVRVILTCQDDVVSLLWLSPKTRWPWGSPKPRPLHQINSGQSAQLPIFSLTTQPPPHTPTQWPSSPPPLYGPAPDPAAQVITHSSSLATPHLALCSQVSSQYSASQSMRGKDTKTQQECNLTKFRHLHIVQQHWRLSKLLDCLLVAD